MHRLRCMYGASSNRRAARTQAFQKYVSYASVCMYVMHQRQLQLEIGVSPLRSQTCKAVPNRASAHLMLWVARAPLIAAFKRNINIAPFSCSLAQVGNLARHTAEPCLMQQHSLPCLADIHSMVLRARTSQQTVPSETTTKRTSAFCCCSGDKASRGRPTVLAWLALFLSWLAGALAIIGALCMSCSR